MINAALHDGLWPTPEACREYLERRGFFTSTSLAKRPAAYPLRFRSLFRSFDNLGDLLFADIPHNKGELLIAHPRDCGHVPERPLSGNDAVAYCRNKTLIGEFGGTIARMNKRGPLSAAHCVLAVTYCAARLKNFLALARRRRKQRLATHRSLR